MNEIKTRKETKNILLTERKKKKAGPKIVKFAKNNFALEIEDIGDESRSKDN